MLIASFRLLTEFWKVAHLQCPNVLDSFKLQGMLKQAIKPHGPLDVISDIINPFFTFGLSPAVL